MVQLVVLLCATLRGARLVRTKLDALRLLNQASKHCDEDTRLQRTVPYFLCMVRIPKQGLVWLLDDT
jgi:hypothetical protein